MSYERVQHAGGAIPTTLGSDITSGATSATLAAATGWPDGSTGPFYLVINPGGATEEKILATSRTTLTLNTLSRGVDGTSASAHVSGETIVHCFTAVEADEANVLVHATLGTYTAKGDESVATAANTLGKLAVGADDTVRIADSGQATGQKWDKIVAANITAATITTTELADGAVTTAILADDSVTSAKIVDGSIATADLADGLVTTAKLADGAVTLVKIGPHLFPVQTCLTGARPGSPAQGMVIYETDTDRIYARTASAWVFVWEADNTEANPQLTYRPSGDEDVTASATWPFGLHLTVTVPVWAKYLDAFVKIGQAYQVTSTGNSTIQLLLGGLLIDETPHVRWDPTEVDTGAKQDLVLAGTADISALQGTSVTFRTLGNRLSGTGALRVDSESQCYIKGLFRP